MLSQVRATVAHWGMVDPPQHVVVAVSGGADSIAMLYALFWLRHDLGLTLTAAHLDHCIREDSPEDAAVVRIACQDLEIPLHEERVDVPSLRGRRGNLEEAARHARYAFLERIAALVDAHSIALGHTRTDLAETVLLHLLRGAGPTGLRGLPAVRGPYMRPLVDCSRSQTHEFCRAHDLPFREDPTNLDLRYTRNAVRLELLPQLERFNPKAEQALARSAHLWEEAQQALLWAARQGLTLATTERGLDLDTLSTLPEQVQRLVLRQAAADALGEERKPTKAHVDALWKLCKNRTGESHLPRGLRAWVHRGELFLGKAGPGRAYQHPIPVPGEMHLPEGGWTLRTALDAPPADPASHGPWVAHLDHDTLSLPLAVRTRRPGDRFRPLGMVEDVRVSQLMSKAGVPRHLRDGWPLLCDRRDIVWVVGVRISEHHKVTANTQRVLRAEAVREL